MSEDEVYTIPLQRRFVERDPTSPVEGKSWLQAMSSHPVITVLAGIAHMIGLGRVASTLSAMSITSLHSVDIDNFEEYDIFGAAGDIITPTTDSPFGYGFYVAITPPHQPGHRVDRFDEPLQPVLRSNTS